MEDRMYGVVLWADSADKKAVIWCEDQGNLAFYFAPKQNFHLGVSLDAGDLIQFDVEENADCRCARNPQRVNTGYAPGLAATLKAQQPMIGAQAGSNVVPFPAR